MVLDTLEKKNSKLNYFSHVNYIFYKKDFLNDLKKKQENKIKDSLIVESLVEVVYLFYY